MKKPYRVGDRTPWLENTALHLAVKGKQLEVAKVLVYEFNADVLAENVKGSNCIDYCQKFISDEAVRLTMMGLLEKTSKSTKVPKNLPAQRAARQKKIEEDAEALQLRRRLKAAIKEQGPDFSLSDMFKKFDFNGDGCFDQTEFESAFTVLEIDFKRKNLRRLIELADTNKDGKISFKEFNSYLYQSDLQDGKGHEAIELVDGDSDDE